MDGHDIYIYIFFLFFTMYVAITRYFLSHTCVLIVNCNTGDVWTDDDSSEFSYGSDASDDVPADEIDALLEAGLPIRSPANSDASAAPTPPPPCVGDQSTNGNLSDAQSANKETDANSVTNGSVPDALQSKPQNNRALGNDEQPRDIEKIVLVGKNNIKKICPTSHHLN